MEYLDFSSVITIIRKYINDERTVVDRNLNEEVKIDQMHLLLITDRSAVGSMGRQESALESFPFIWMKKTGICFQLI